MFKRPKNMIIAAGVLTLSTVSTMALAHTYERCDADGDHCVRIKCDNDGDKCWRESEYAKSDMYSRPGRWVCDSDGDRCHYVYSNRERHEEHHEEHHDRD